MELALTPLSLLTPPESPDYVLVARAGSGDPDALAALYHRYARPLYGLAHRLLGDSASAEDVLHDVFLGLPEALARYEERGTFEHWLKRLVARVALNRIRSRTRRRETSFAGAPEQHARVSHPVDAIALSDALARLPQSLGTVFVLKEIDGFSHAEIAGLLQISVSASEVRLHRAMRALRTFLGPDR